MEIFFRIVLKPERERTLIKGRADAIYSRIIIEYEPPLSLRQSNGHKNNSHAIEQIKQYMTELEMKDKHHLERLAGVVLDGSFFIFIRYRDN
jgi:hypothetical protein